MAVKKEIAERGARVAPQMPRRQPELETTLQERGSRYGVFADQAAIEKRMTDDWRGAPGWERLAPDQAQALAMIAVKVARILNGDPNFHDSWHDISGYAKLVADRLLTI